MGKIYVGQTALKFEATLDQDITSATCLIKYRKPGGDTGSWDATITDTANGVIEYEVADADQIDVAGNWTFWGYATFSDGTKAAGEMYRRVVYEEGTG